ncbi:hypothetical protein V6N13_002766 [Hibiscus sabdariffa]
MSCDIFVKIKRKDIDFAPPTALVATALLGAAPLVATNPASLVAMVAAITLLQLEAHHPASTINTPAPPVALHPYRSTNVDPTPLKYLRSLPCLVGIEILSQCIANRFVSLLFNELECSISSNKSKSNHKSSPKSLGNKDRKFVVDLFPITKMKNRDKKFATTIPKNTRLGCRSEAVGVKDFIHDSLEQTWFQKGEIDDSWIKEINCLSGRALLSIQALIVLVFERCKSFLQLKFPGNSQLEDFERAREGNPGISECQGPIATSGRQTGCQIWPMLKFALKQDRVQRQRISQG